MKLIRHMAAGEVRVWLGVHKAFAAPYGGRYPCASLVHNGIWYYGTYCLDWHQHPWDILGPFVGFRLSPDGKAYLLGHGATRPEATCSWISGSRK